MQNIDTGKVEEEEDIVRVCVALVIQHEKRMRRIILSFVACFYHFFFYVFL
jgi:hypothetical protein